MRKVTYLNTNTGKLVEGEYYYNWGADRFTIDIGNKRFVVYDEHPETEIYKIFENGKIKYPTSKKYKFTEPCAILQKTNPSSFFFHYNKPESAKKGRPQLSVHHKGKCFIVDGVQVNVPTYSWNRKLQPRCVIRGKCQTVEIKDGIAVIS